MSRYSYFIAYDYNACPKGVIKTMAGRREPSLKPLSIDERNPVVRGSANLAMLFDSPINSYQQVLDAQTIILKQNEFFLDVSIQFYQFLYEEPEEGNHESGPEQEDEEFPQWTSRPPGNHPEGRVGGRYRKGTT